MEQTPRQPTINGSYEEVFIKLLTFGGKIIGELVKRSFDGAI